MRGRSTAHSRDRRWRDRLWPRPVEAGPRVVVPLGMHRSGLSVATALIHRLGVPVDEEGRRIVEAHDRLFARFGSSWMHPRLTTPLPETWHRDVEVTAIRRELVGLLREALSRNRGLWAFNDPRTVRFLPLWQRIFAEIGARPSWILVVRHPAAVIASLAPRSGLSRARCELLWIEHYLDALAHIERSDLVVLRFERLLADPAWELRRLLNRLPFLAARSEEELASIAATILDATRVHEGPDRGRGRDDACTKTALMIHDWLEALAADRPLPQATPAGISAAAAQDLARLVERDRANGAAPLV